MCPVFATRFTANLLRRKLDDDGVELPSLKEIPLGAKMECGPFGVELVGLTHSIPEPNAVVISTPAGKIFHTGDWKLDEAPVLGEDYDEARIRQVGAEGVTAMVCDSTNAMISGISGSEQSAAESLKEVIGGVKGGRVAVGCFASNVARLDAVVSAATAAGRKVALIGRSMERVVGAARDSGYLQNWPKLHDPAALASARPEEVLYLCTGSQGEPRAALTKLAGKRHPHAKLEAGDTVVFSSRVIPGNDRSVFALQNRLIRNGITVRTAEQSPVHVSGHPCRDELAELYKWVQPDCSIPVHGEARQQAAHLELARSLGVGHGLVPENGDVVRIAPADAKTIGRVAAGRWAVEGERLIDDSSSLYAERRALADSGVIFCSLVLDEDGALLYAPHMAAYGVFDRDAEREDEERMAQALERIAGSVLGLGGGGGRGGGRGRRRGRPFAGVDAARREIRRQLREVCKSDLGTRPRIEVEFVEPEGRA